jgi:hypothetical protein
VSLLYSPHQIVGHAIVTDAADVRIDQQRKLMCIDLAHLLGNLASDQQLTATLLHHA